MSRATEIIEGWMMDAQTMYSRESHIFPESNFAFNSQGNVSRAGEIIGRWTLESRTIYSEYNISFVEASRACNMASGDTETALKKFKISKFSAAVQQGKVQSYML